jgi:Ca2+/Na+ antiporter
MALLISVFILLIIVGLILPDKFRKKFTRNQWILFAVVVLMLLLTLTGRLNVLTALGGMILALMSRIPNLLKWWGVWSQIRQRQQTNQQNDQEKANTHQQRAASAKGQMTREEALNILGLNEGATRKDVNLAYKRLIQKLHPDRGGSEALAAEVNQARDVLLK